MITYYLTLSNVFPKGHRKEGTPTFFKNMVLAATRRKKGEIFKPKIHTIRANYDFWAKRFEKIAAGEACLSIRKWVGKPYAKGSTQREIVRLTKEDGIGIQKLEIVRRPCGIGEVWIGYIDGILMDHSIPFDGFGTLARNDGLSLDDWISWFRNYDLSKPMAIIHFTKFRYQYD